MIKYYYLNGKVVPADKALLPITDIGIQRGYGVFDFTRTFNGVPFQLDEHLDRFERSARAMHLLIPDSRAKIKKVISQLLKKNGFKESTVKVGLTGGEAHGLEFIPNKSTLFIQVDECHPLPPRLYRDGVKLLTMNYQRQLPAAKTTDYMVAVETQVRCRRAGALEGLYAPGGIVKEAASSNFFMFKGDTLITPKEGILIGITRQFVIRLAKKMYTVRERDITLRELRSASEAFITASKKDILPVTKIDSFKIGDGRVGPRTRALMDLYHKTIYNR